jgi:glucose/arabinose dehydrogenase
MLSLARTLAVRTILVLGVAAGMLVPAHLAAAQSTDATLEEWTAGTFNQPTYITNAGDDRLFVVEQPGTVQVVADANAPEAGSELFLDLTDRVGSDGTEQGLLSIEFPPDSHDNNVVYASYSDLNGDSVISRFDLSEDSLTADPATEQIVLTQPQPFQNHNGGLILFGPDDMLYIGFGDGGSQGDPDGNGQDPSTWLGKLLRIDVNPANLAEGEGYAVPEDNPFLDDPDAAPEVWMNGLRNPWRFAFDAEGTMIAVADVGQNQIEEVTILPFEDAAGANLGWNIMEGSTCYQPSDCDTSGLTLPSVEYTHEEGGCSVSGGEFIGGAYVYADFCSGLLWVATQDDGGAWSASTPSETGLGPSSFGLGGDGTVYLGDRASGTIYRVVLDS